MTMTDRAAALAVIASATYNTYLDYGDDIPAPIIDLVASIAHPSHGTRLTEDFAEYATELHQLTEIEAGQMSPVDVSPFLHASDYAEAEAIQRKRVNSCLFFLLHERYQVPCAACLRLGLFPQVAPHGLTCEQHRQAVAS